MGPHPCRDSVSRGSKGADESMSLYGLASSPMPMYGHVWVLIALNDLTQLCTIFVLVFCQAKLSKAKVAALLASLVILDFT